MRWGTFEEQHPEATLEDFFRYQLSAPGTAQQEETEPGQLVPDINGRLMILLRRIGKYHIFYSNKALEGTGLDQIEEFGILVTIHNQVNPIKSEAIYNNVIELSSGTNMLIRLKKRGLINEYADKDDKRVKRLQLTAKGKETLQKAKVLVLQVAKLMLDNLSDDDKQLCLQLLAPVQDRFAGLVQKQKNKTFEEIFKNMVDE
jgi:DNA-binding MarR family transcriptional regulator